MVPLEAAPPPPPPPTSPPLRAHTPHNHPTTPAAQDLYSSVFSLLHHQGSVGAGAIQAALAEYVASLAAHALPLSPSLATFYVDLLLDQVG